MLYHVFFFLFCYHVFYLLDVHLKVSAENPVQLLFLHRLFAPPHPLLLLKYLVVFCCILMMLLGADFIFILLGLDFASWISNSWSCKWGIFLCLFAMLPLVAFFIRVKLGISHKEPVFSCRFSQIQSFNTFQHLPCSRHKNYIWELFTTGSWSRAFRFAAWHAFCFSSVDW